MVFLYNSEQTLYKNMLFCPNEKSKMLENGKSCSTQ